MFCVFWLTSLWGRESWGFPFSFFFLFFFFFFFLTSGGGSGGGEFLRVSVVPVLACRGLIRLVPLFKMGGEQSSERRFHGEVHMLKIEPGGKITPVVELSNAVTVSNVSDEQWGEIVEGEVKELGDKLEAAMSGVQTLSQIQSGGRGREVQWSDVAGGHGK